MSGRSLIRLRRRLIIFQDKINVSGGPNKGKVSHRWLTNPIIHVAFSQTPSTFGIILMKHFPPLWSITELSRYCITHAPFIYFAFLLNCSFKFLYFPASTLPNIISHPPIRFEQSTTKTPLRFVNNCHASRALWKC